VFAVLSGESGKEGSQLIETLFRLRLGGGERADDAGPEHAFFTSLSLSPFAGGGEARRRIGFREASLACRPASPSPPNPGSGGPGLGWVVGL
jgi:hypothetical protein